MSYAGTTLFSLLGFSEPGRLHAGASREYVAEVSGSRFGGDTRESQGDGDVLLEGADTNLSEGEEDRTGTGWPWQFGSPSRCLRKTKL